MARKRERESLADMLSCQVCLEEFEEEGVHTPRLSPCSHSLCESCIEKMIKNNIIECPECRTEHRAEKKEKSFPQNRYLFVQIRSRKRHKRDTNETDDRDKCKNHGKELNIFCHQTICISCLKTEHNGHDWEEFEEREKEALVREVTEGRKNLEKSMETISKVMKDVDENTGSCVKELKKIEEEFAKEIAKKIEKAERQGKETSKQAEKELSAMETNIECLRSIQDDIADYATDYNTIRQYRETVRQIIHNNQGQSNG